jgi:hypothetical protein
LPISGSVREPDTRIPLGLWAVDVLQERQFEATAVTVEKEKGRDTIRSVKDVETINDTKHINKYLGSNAAVLRAAAECWDCLTVDFANWPLWISLKKAAGVTSNVMILSNPNRFCIETQDP